MTRPSLIDPDGTIHCDWRVNIYDCADREFFVAALIFLLALCGYAIAVSAVALIFKLHLKKLQSVTMSLLETDNFERMVLCSIAEVIVCAIHAMILLWAPQSSHYLSELTFIFPKVVNALTIIFLMRTIIDMLMTLDYQFSISPVVQAVWSGHIAVVTVVAISAACLTATFHYGGFGIPEQLMLTAMCDIVSISGIVNYLTFVCWVGGVITNMRRKQMELHQRRLLRTSYPRLVILTLSVLEGVAALVMIAHLPQLFVNQVQSRRVFMLYLFPSAFFTAIRQTLQLIYLIYQHRKQSRFTDSSLTLTAPDYDTEMSLQKLSSEPPSSLGLSDPFVLVSVNSAELGHTPPGVILLRGRSAEFHTLARSIERPAFHSGPSTPTGQRTFNDQIFLAPHLIEGKLALSQSVELAL